MRSNGPASAGRPPLPFPSSCLPPFSPFRTPHNANVFGMGAASAAAALAAAGEHGRAGVMGDGMHSGMGSRPGSSLSNVAALTPPGSVPGSRRTSFDVQAGPSGLGPNAQHHIAASLNLLSGAAGNGAGSANGVGGHAHSQQQQHGFGGFSPSLGGGVYGGWHTMATIPEPAAAAYEDVHASGSHANSSGGARVMSGAVMKGVGCQESMHHASGLNLVADM